MLGHPEGSLTRPVMGCKDSLGPYWANKLGNGPISEGNGPISEGNGPNRDRDDSEGAPGLRRSARPRCQSRLQQWEGASTSKGKAGRDGKTLLLERLTIPGGEGSSRALTSATGSRLSPRASSTATATTPRASTTSPTWWTWKTRAKNPPQGTKIPPQMTREQTRVSHMTHPPLF